MPDQKLESVRSVRLPGGIELSLVAGDITQLKVDAIVNAANASLQHGGGVAAAIVRAGGSIIQDESSRWVEEHGPINPDRPAITASGDLPARFVIHAVGPIWGEGDEHDKLDRAVTGALALAEQKCLSSLALPAISTGIFRFPLNEAARVILTSIARFSQTEGRQHLKSVTIALWDTTSVLAFSSALDLIPVQEAESQ